MLSLDEGIILARVRLFSLVLASLFWLWAHFSSQYLWNYWYLYFYWCSHHRLRGYVEVESGRRHARCKERRLGWAWSLKFRYPGLMRFVYVDLPSYGTTNMKTSKGVSESSTRQVLKEISRANFLSLAICALSKVQGSSSQAHWELEPLLLSFLLWLHLVILRLRSSKSLSLRWTRC